MNAKPQQPGVTSPRSMARIAGTAWLVTFLLGMFALINYGSVAVAGNAAATAANILSREAFYRAGVVANLISAVAYIVATLFVYYLLRPVDRKISLLAAMFSLVACALSGLSFVFQLAPIFVLRGAAYAKVFSVEQVQTLARMFLQLSDQTNGFSFVFFGLHVFLVGALIVRSTFLHRVVGMLMLFGGLGWMTFAFSNLASPAIGQFLSPWILFPGILGEGSLIFWLLLKGVNAERWEEQAIASGQWPSHRIVEA